MSMGGNKQITHTCTHSSYSRHTRGPEVGLADSMLLLFVRRWVVILTLQQQQQQIPRNGPRPLPLMRCRSFELSANSRGSRGPDGFTAGCRSQSKRSLSLCCSPHVDECISHVHTCHICPGRVLLVQVKQCLLLYMTRCGQDDRLQ